VVVTIDTAVIYDIDTGFFAAVSLILIKLGTIAFEITVDSIYRQVEPGMLISKSQT